MKNCTLFFLLLSFLFSCSKDEDIKANWAPFWQGRFTTSEQSGDTLLITAWAITPKDNNHINIVIEEERSSTSNPEQKQSSAIYVDNVLVESAKLIILDNEFRSGSSVGKMTGTAKLDRNWLTYDLKLSDKSGSKSISNTLYLR
ncbi:hypothetical protein LZD49_34675 [Dyadobacter sp. CY261]|uniref:hypothetical protein n=1 Tax=Dyadobacter sp. CY261 TaxID=2907203 RepID=UPI001F321A90|nr:hypothetical protein [Dyadobacter sp. CY261]MCF0075669.1 hypothetical protein [Dyadobacter sp. CY261]